MSREVHHGFDEIFQLASLPAAQRQEPERLPHVLTSRRRFSLETSKEKEYTMPNEFEED